MYNSKICSTSCRFKHVTLKLPRDSCVLGHIHLLVLLVMNCELTACYTIVLKECVMVKLPGCGNGKSPDVLVWSVFTHL